MQAINQFGSAPSLTLTLPGPSNVTPRDSVCLASSATHNGFGSTSTLKAEILWVLNTVTKHQSYKGNDDIAELFRARGFPPRSSQPQFRKTWSSQPRLKIVRVYYNDYGNHRNNTKGARF